MCRRQEWGTVCLEAAVHSATADVINSAYRLDVITPAWCPPCAARRRVVVRFWAASLARCAISTHVAM